MKPGFIKCPLCGRPTKLNPRTGQMCEHYASFSKPGMGLRGNAKTCRGSHRKPEDVA